MNLTDLASILDAELVGNGELEIHGIARIEQASAGEITFLANPKYHPFLRTTGATAVLIARDADVQIIEERSSPPALLKVDDPYLSFLKVMATFHPPSPPLSSGIHPTAVIAPDARIEGDVRIGAHVVIGSRTVVHRGGMIGHNTVIGDDVVIGSNSLIYHNVTIREGCRIGAGVIVHSGTTIGSDGFGFAPRKDGTYEKIPQLGIVVIEDDVEIGANCTIDRATMGETRIRRGTKLDNLIQVAHNVVIGEDTVIAAQAGISGSTKIGRGAMIGGQVGITGHLTIEENTHIGAQSGVHRSVRTPGTTLFGSPAMPKREAFRVQGAIPHLPDLLDTVKKLKAAVERLEAKLGNDSTS